MLSKVPVITQDDLGVGWRVREDWRKYGWESQEDYMNNQWRIKRDADYVDQTAILGRHTSHLSENTLDCMALSETYLSSYYAKASAFFYSLKENRTL